MTSELETPVTLPEVCEKNDFVFSRKSVFIVLLLVIIALQWKGGAFQAEFGSNPDESAHYVTGLLVHDYVAAGLPGSPLSYARNYYLHYPRVALGHWPPLFYIAQAAWTLIFTPSRISVMLLIAVITALLGTILFAGIRQDVSAFAGFGAAVFFLSLPITELYSQEVMAETLLALLVLLAFLDFSRYLEAPGWKYAVRFGVWCALALFTKATAIELIGMVLLAIPVSGRFRLMKRLDFWLPLILVACATAPWYLWMPGAQHESVARFGGLFFSPSRIATTPIALIEFTGILPAIAAVTGIAIRTLRPRGRPWSGKWTAGLSLLLSAWLLRVFVSVWDERQLFNLVPILVIFATAGLAGVFRGQPALKTPVVVLTVTLLVLLNVRNTPPKLQHAYTEAAHNLVSDAQLRDSVFLVCGDAEGEGMLISEIAMGESRPTHFVLRATKVLASGDWSGGRYRVLFKNPDEVMDLLDRIPVGVVVIDDRGRRTEHGRLLMESLLRYPGKWVLTATYSPDHVLVYRRAGSETGTAGGIHLPVLSTVYGTINE